ncbi:MAG: hypothetical protein ACREJR_06820 [Candidatus Rokuibacteriota bacterium]
MPRMRNARLAIGLSLAVVASVAGCSSLDSGQSAAAALPGAVYAGQVPLYPAATFEGAMGGTTYGSVGGPAVNESLSWFFAVADPPEKVLAFYEAKLAGARRDVNAEDEPTLTLVPTGADDGEYLRVTVGAGRLQITEVVRAGKRKDG